MIELILGAQKLRQTLKSKLKNAEVEICLKNLNAHFLPKKTLSRGI